MIHELMLIRPSKLYAEQVMSYKECYNVEIVLMVVQVLKMSNYLMSGLNLREA